MLPTVNNSTTNEIQKEESSADSPFPSNVAGHRVLRQIGQGSYGGVWLAQNIVTGTYRALKIVWRKAFSDSRPYDREYEAIKTFEPLSRSHPGFVHVLQIGSLPDAFYYIMELGDDESRGSHVDPETYKPRTLGANRARGLPLDQCIDICASLAGTLQVLHDAGLLHRDIKPSNVIFVGGRPKLADIGLVVAIDEARSMVGTTGFVPPEGPTSIRADIFSLGKLLYEISTGNDRCHFPALPANITGEDALLLELNQIYLRACQPNPEERHPTARALQQELELLQAGRSIKRIRILQRRQRKIIFAGAIAVVVGLTAFIVYAQINAAEARQNEERARKAGYFISKGTDAMREGDYATALPFFASAAEIDPDHHRNYSLRIGSSMAFAAKPISQFRVGRGGILSSDGAWIAVPHPGQPCLDIYDVRTSEMVEEIPGDGPLTFSLDGKLAAVATGQNVRLVEVESGRVLERARLSSVPKALALHPDNHTIAAVLSSGVAVILPFIAGPEVPLKEQSPYSVLFSPSGEYLLTGNLMGSPKIWKVATGELHSTGYSHKGLNFREEPLPGEISIVYRGVFLKDGQTVVTGGSDSQAVAWDLHTGKEVSRGMGHHDAIADVAVSPSGTMLATAALDRTVRLWRTSGFLPARHSHTLYHAERILGVRFLDDQRLVALGRDGAVYLWDITPDVPVPQKLDEPPALAPRTVAEAPGIRLEGRDNIIEGTAFSKPVKVTMPANVSTIAIHPSLKYFAAASSDLSLTPYDARLFFIDGKPTGIRFPHADGVLQVFFSADGERLVTCSEDFTARIWSTFDGRPLVPPLRHRYQVHGAAFDETEEWIVTASWDRTSIIWDTQTGDQLTPAFPFGEMLVDAQFAAGQNAIVARGASGSYMLKLPLANAPFDGYHHAIYSPETADLNW